MRRASTFDSTIASSSADNAPRISAVLARRRARQRLAIDGDAEQTDRAPGHVLELPERDRIGMSTSSGDRRPCGTSR